MLTELHLSAGLCSMALALPCALVPHRIRFHELACVGSTVKPSRPAASHAHHHPQLPCRQFVL